MREACSPFHENKLMLLPNTHVRSHAAGGVQQVLKVGHTARQRLPADTCHGDGRVKGNDILLDQLQWPRPESQLLVQVLGEPGSL